MQIKFYETYKKKSLIIFITNWMCFKKIIKIKVELGEEEEEEAGCSRDHTAKKKPHMYHHSVMLCSWPFGEVVHNSPRVACIF
jgi:hypothetical protein